MTSMSQPSPRYRVTNRRVTAIKSECLSRNWCAWTTAHTATPATAEQIISDESLELTRYEASIFRHPCPSGCTYRAFGPIGPVAPVAPTGPGRPAGPGVPEDPRAPKRLDVPWTPGCPATPCWHIGPLAHVENIKIQYFNIPSI